jgi:hypothetical protein
MVMGVGGRCRRLKKRRAGYRNVWHQKGAKHLMKINTNTCVCNSSNPCGFEQKHKTVDSNLNQHRVGQYPKSMTE